MSDMFRLFNACAAAIAGLTTVVGKFVGAGATAGGETVEDRAMEAGLRELV